MADKKEDKPKKAQEDGQEQSIEQPQEAGAQLSAELDHVERLHKLQRKLSNETDLKTALAQIVEASNNFLDTDRGCIQLVSDDGERLEMYVYQGYDEQDAFIQHFLHEGSKPACDRARQTQERLVIEDVENFDPFKGTKDREVALESDIRATQSTPMISRSGELVGVLSNQFPEPHRPDENQLKFIDLLAWTAAEFIDRYQQNEKLRESSERLESATDAAEVAVWELDLQNDEGLYISPRYAKMLGYEEVPEDWNVERALEHYHPDDQERLMNYLEDGLGERMFESQITRTDGEQRWILVGSKVYEGSDGTPVRAVGTMQDITEHKQRERSNARLAAIVNDSDDAIISKDLDGIVKSWNKGAENIFGYTAEEVVGRSITVLFPKDRLDEEDEILEQLRHGKQIDHYETVRRHKDGALLNVSLTISPIRNAEGQIIGASKIARDITERKRREQKQEYLIKLNDALRPLTDAVKIEETACRLLAEHLEVNRVYYPDINEDKGSIKVEREYLNGSTPSIAGKYPLQKFNWILQPLHNGEAAAIEDLKQADGLSREEAAAMEQIQSAAKLTVPLLKNGKLAGALSATQKKPRAWQKYEIELMRETLERTWAAAKRGRAEKNLIENERRLRNAVKAANHGTWELDMETGSFISRSLRHDQIFGYDEKQETWDLKKTLDHIFLDDKEHFIQAVKHAKKSGELVFEGRIQEIDNSIRWIYAKGTVISTNKDNQPEKMAGVVADTTKQKRHTALEKTQNRLLELIAIDQPLQDTLRELCEAVPTLNPGVRASILIADEKGEAFQHSVAPDLLSSWGETLDGAPINELMIGTCGEAVFRDKPVSCTNVKEDDRWSDEWRKLCLANGILAGYSQPIRPQSTEAKGSFMLCFNEPREPNEWEHQLLRFGAHIAGIALDRDRTKQSLREHNERLEERVRQRTASLKKSQHKLRSLVSELNKAEERERERIATDLHDNLGQMLAVCKMKIDFGSSGKNEELSHAADLLDDAINYTRELMSSLTPPDRFDEEDVKKAVQWIGKRMKKYDLIIDIEDDGEPKPLSDEVRSAVLRAIRELLFNVVKHSGEKEAVVQLSRSDGYLKAAVKDDGLGFDQDGEQEIDEQAGGFGLLNIAERLNLLEGDLAINSKPEKGTTVVITVPLRKKQEEIDGESTPPGRQLETKFKNKEAGLPAGVMLVDDHDITREGLVKIIKEEDGLQLSGEAKNGREAVEKTRELLPDVIVMDINMPEMNGIEATEIIKKEWSDIQVIGLSFYNDEEKAEAMRKAGASAFITKSNAMEKLCDTIRDV